MNPNQIPSITLDGLPEGAHILDVREDFEWAAGHVEGAVHVPMNDVPNRVSYEPDLLANDRTTYVICAMGGRSGQVTAWLVQNGHDAVNVAGGMHAWADSGRPMVSDTGRPATVA
ncbi:MAG: rhodanese-like domain-containing protein [Jatrophihabitantaceae bacterium]